MSQSQDQTKIDFNAAGQLVGDDSHHSARQKNTEEGLLGIENCTEGRNQSISTVETQPSLEPLSTRRIPPEILMEIFEWYSEGRILNRELALVCRTWKSILISMPSLWRMVEAYHVADSDSQEAQARLERRIELARSTFLNVYLSSAHYTLICSNRILFEVILKTDTSRWKSLELVDRSNRSPLSKYLDSLHLRQFFKVDVDHSKTSQTHDWFREILRIIARGDPRLEAMLARQLLNMEQPICPNLVTLRLVSGSLGFDKRNWQDAARMVFELRRGMALDLIEWKCMIPGGSTTWTTIRRADVEGIRTAQAAPS